MLLKRLAPPITCLSTELLKQFVILVAVKFTADLAGKHSHEPVADLLNGGEYGVDLTEIG